jgi:hypothetical protein
LDKLKWFCNSEYCVITKPVLSDHSSSSSTHFPSNQHERTPIRSDGQTILKNVLSNKYKIITNKGSASVLTSTFQKLGNTPLELDKESYIGKLVLITNGKETKKIRLDSQQNFIEIKFDQ